MDVHHGLPRRCRTFVQGPISQRTPAKTRNIEYGIYARVTGQTSSDRALNRIFVGDVSDEKIGFL
jgi:hypothetical protein